MRAAAAPLLGGVAGRLFRGGAATFLVNAVGMALGFLLQVTLAHWLGAETFGVYAYVWTWLNLLAWAAVMGHDMLVLREVAALRATAAWALLLGLRRHVRLLVSGLSVALAAGGAMLVSEFAPDRELKATFLVGLAALVPMALLRLHAALLCGVGRVIHGILPERVGRDAIVLSLLGAAALGGLAPAPQLAMTFTAIGILAALVAVVAMEPATIRGALPGTPREARPRAWLGSALALGTMAGTQLVMQRTDIVMLGALDGVAGVGIYTVAAALADLVYFTHNAVGSVFGSVLATHFARGEREEMLQALRVTARLGAGGGIAAAIPLIAFAPWILDLFGPGFDEGAIALRILAVAFAIRCFMGPVALLLTMTGHERDAARSFAASALANVILNLALIPPLGILGAALATGAASLGVAVTMAVMARRRLGITPAQALGFGRPA
ncbi:MATE family efflux transporter [Arenibaculum pallidiluteum]|uniref:MATE family efflux transporter n=1 Tax=Arenibaculum pallidiluteum TaxID=2812559 RepID=UPI001A97801F|nr:polysaccharide biosynthesis C-terminal domain-containing protein [Arenibaculum pallidiluteum]